MSTTTKSPEIQKLTQDIALVESSIEDSFGKSTIAESRVEDFVIPKIRNPHLITGNKFHDFTPFLKIISEFLPSKDNLSLFYSCKIVQAAYHTAPHKFFQKNMQYYISGHSVDNFIYIDMKGIDKWDKNEQCKFRLRWFKILVLRDYYSAKYDECNARINEIICNSDISRDKKNNFAKVEFKKLEEETHDCSFCTEKVSFELYLKDPRTRSFGNTFMCCEHCKQHNTWSLTEARSFWKCKKSEASEIPFWRSSSLRRYATEDLLAFKLSQKKTLEPGENEDSKESKELAESKVKVESMNITETEQTKVSVESAIDVDSDDETLDIEEGSWERLPDLPAEIRNALNPPESVLKQLETQLMDLVKKESSLAPQNPAALVWDFSKITRLANTAIAIKNSLPKRESNVFS